MSAFLRVLAVASVVLGIVLAVLPGDVTFRDTRDIDTTPDAVNAHVPFRVAMLITGLVAGYVFWWLGGRRPDSDEPDQRDAH